METLWLNCHQEGPQDALSGISAVLGRKGSEWLSVEFRALGDMSKVILPNGGDVAALAWNQADGLWEHTCFELFVRADDAEGYLEMNFATSREWAAYRFADYRSGMRKADEIELVKAVRDMRPRRTKVMAVVRLPHDFWGKPWKVGLSAVIEELDGTKSYWALAHPPGKPDFHHPACFAATLPAPL